MPSKSDAPFVSILEEAFHRMVRECRASGMDDVFIARQVTDDLYRACGVSFHESQQHLVEEKVRASAHVWAKGDRVRAIQQVNMACVPGDLGTVTAVAAGVLTVDFDGHRYERSHEAQVILDDGEVELFVPQGDEDSSADLIAGYVLACSVTYAELAETGIVAAVLSNGGITREKALLAGTDNYDMEKLDPCWICLAEQEAARRPVIERRHLGEVRRKVPARKREAALRRRAKIAEAYAKAGGAPYEIEDVGPDPVVPDAVPDGDGEG